MSNVFYTADLHIGHRLVAETRGFFGASAVDEHDHTLACKWEDAVGKRDVVYVLGDLSSGSPGATRLALKLLSWLPGRKRLIAGNHDPVHGMYRDSHKWHREFMEVFESVSEFGRRKAEGVEFMMSHLPYIGDHTDEDRFDQYRLRNMGLPLVHGHVHDQWAVEYAGSTPMVNVGLDAWGMELVSQEELVEVLRESGA